MRVAANASLGRTRSGQPVGYAVLNVAGDVIKPFTMEGVREDFTGWWSVENGVELPDAGGYIRWSTRFGEHLAQEGINPLPVFDATAIMRQIDGLVRGLERAMAQQSAQVGEMAKAPAAVAELVQAQSEDIAFVKSWCEQMIGYSRMSGELSDLQTRLDRLFPGRQRTQGVTSEMTATERAQYEAKISALQSKMASAVAVIDRYIAAAEGNR